MTKGRTIKTDFIYPPIPTRNFDWQAALDGYDAGDPLGHGATEIEAIQDLLTQLEEREEPDAVR